MIAESPMRMLVVDDNEDAAVTLSLLPRHLGHDSQVATGAEAA